MDQEDALRALAQFDPQTYGEILYECCGDDSYRSHPEEEAGDEFYEEGDFSIDDEEGDREDEDLLQLQMEDDFYEEFRQSHSGEDWPD